MTRIAIVEDDPRLASPSTEGSWREDVFFDELTVVDFPRSEYGLDHVKRAGEIIIANADWAESEADIREAFRIANNWRESHAYPMRSVRGSLRWYMHYHGLEGVTVARLKRMQAIRRKLTRSSLKLHQLQDLGGSRYPSKVGGCS